MLGFSLAGWMNQIMLCNTGHRRSWRSGCLSCPPTRRCTPGPAPPRKPWRILTAVGKFRGREITSAIRPNDVFFMGRRRDSSPQHLHLLAIRSSAHQQSYLLSSVDPVLYCDTNGPTHAPTVLSLAPSPASVCASSLGPLRVVRFLLSCFAERCIHYCLCATSAALLFASFIMLRVMICFLCTLVLPIMPSNSKWPAVLTTSQYFNLLVPRVGRSCAKTNAD